MDCLRCRGYAVEHGVMLGDGLADQGIPLRLLQTRYLKSSSVVSRYFFEID